MIVAWSMTPTRRQSEEETAEGCSVSFPEEQPPENRASRLRGLSDPRNRESDADMASIRIVGVPPGPAPQWVREEWVGLVLPLPEGPMGRRRLLNMSAVLPPSRGFLSSLFESSLYPWLIHLYAWLTQSLMKVDGYAVEALRAVEILSVDSPEAAAWWHQHAPSLMKPGRLFVFHAEVCDEEP